MPKYRFQYTTEDWWRLDIEAASLDEAMQKFHMDQYNPGSASLIESGYLQDSVEVEEIPDA